MMMIVMMMMMMMMMMMIFVCFVAFAPIWITRVSQIQMVFVNGCFRFLWALGFSSAWTHLYHVTFYFFTKYMTFHF
jgi:hypothetical protein